MTTPVMTDTELREARTALADLVERFARSEIAPHVGAWDAAGEFRARCTPAPPSWGCWPGLSRGARRHARAVRAAPGDVARAVPLRHLGRRAGQPAVAQHRPAAGGGAGRDAVRREVVPPVLAGRQIAALAITEPGGGSDVAAVRTTAREGGEYVVDGEKTFITSGMRADWITVAVRTGEAGTKGSGGLSLLLVPGDSRGLSRTRLDKMGWLCSDTAQLRFDGVRVPARYLLGEEGAGFKAIMPTSTASAWASPPAPWALPRPATTRRWPGRGSARPSASADRAPGDPPQAGRHAAAHPRHRRVAGAAGRARGCWRYRCRLGGRGLHAEEPGDADDAVLRRCRRADPGRHGLHARHGASASTARSRSSPSAAAPRKS
jgi:hypothetical protein